MRKRVWAELLLLWTCIFRRHNCCPRFNTVRKTKINNFICLVGFMMLQWCDCMWLVFNCSQTKFVAIILVLLVFLCGFSLDRFLSDSIDCSSSETGWTCSAWRALSGRAGMRFTWNCFEETTSGCEEQFLVLKVWHPSVNPPPTTTPPSPLPIRRFGHPLFRLSHNLTTTLTTP